MKNERRTYFDNAASASKAQFSVADDFANPNSLHDAGRKSFAALEGARESIANFLRCRIPAEIIFTSGATEANNTAIFGIATSVAKRKGLVGKFGEVDAGRRPKVVTSAIEHDSVLMPVKELENRGFEVVILGCDSSGLITADALANIIDELTCLVTVQLANTEVGIVQDVAALAKEAHKCGAAFHCDMVGALGKIPINLRNLGVDAASFSGHKIGAAKGIGALYLKSGTPFAPLMYGSGQEGGMRSGTQNVAGAASFAKAVEGLAGCNPPFMSELRDYLYAELTAIDGVRRTIQPNNCSLLPNIIHVLVKGKSSQDNVLALNKAGIAVAGGPACSADKIKPSKVLTSLGIPENAALSAMRISLDYDTTKDDCDKLIAAVKDYIEN